MGSSSRSRFKTPTAVWDGNSDSMNVVIMSCKGRRDRAAFALLGCSGAEGESGQITPSLFERGRYLGDGIQSIRPFRTSPDTVGVLALIITCLCDSNSIPCFVLWSH